MTVPQEDSSSSRLLDSPWGRLRAALRDHAPDRRVLSDDVLTAGDLVLDVGAHEVRVDGEVVYLHARPFAVLEQLLRQQGALVPYAVLAGKRRGANSTVATIGSTIAIPNQNNGARFSLRNAVTTPTSANAATSAKPQDESPPKSLSRRGTSSRVNGASASSFVDSRVSWRSRNAEPTVGAHGK